MWKGGCSALPYEAGEGWCGDCFCGRGWLCEHVLLLTRLVHNTLIVPPATPAAVWLLEEEEEIKGGHVPVGGQASSSSSSSCCSSRAARSCFPVKDVFSVVSELAERQAG